MAVGVWVPGIVMVAGEGRWSGSCVEFVPTALTAGTYRLSVLTAYNPHGAAPFDSLHTVPYDVVLTAAA